MLYRIESFISFNKSFSFAYQVDIMKLVEMLLFVVFTLLSLLRSSTSKLACSDVNLCSVGKLEGSFIGDIHPGTECISLSA